MKSLRNSRCSTLLAKRGYQEITDLKVTAKLQGFFHFFRQTAAPFYVLSEQQGYMTLVFDTQSGQIWLIDRWEQLSRPPYCFRDITREARVTQKLLGAQIGI